MATFKGFNTIGQEKKFGLTDFDLIKRDLLNAFMTREGQLPGRPEIGTGIWNYVFEPLDDQTQRAIRREVKRIIGLDARLEIQQLDISANHNTVVVEIAVNVLPDIGTDTLFLVFNQDTESLNIITP